MAFNLFNSLLAGVAVFLGGFAFGHWVTNTDPAFLKILARSERYNFQPAVREFGFESFQPIPISALNGDNVTERSSAAPWYAGSRT